MTNDNDEPENSTGGLTAAGIDMSTVLDDPDDYRHADHAEIVTETDDSLVVADHAHHELNGWADHLDMSRDALSERMHELARDLSDYDWSVVDPVVIAKEDEGSKSPTAEVVKADYREGDEFEFRADVRVRIHNPDGSDVIASRTYEARPKYDDLVSNEDHVHEFVAYWWPNSYPSQGDSPFADSSDDWKPGADLNDDDALLEQCVESATFDPAAELESLKGRSDRVRGKIETDEEAEPA